MAYSGSPALWWGHPGGCSHEGLVLRDSEYDRGTGCGKTARPGLGRGRRVTGVPTARQLFNTFAFMWSKYRFYVLWESLNNLIFLEMSVRPVFNDTQDMQS